MNEYAVPLLRGLLGQDFAALAPAVRRVHDLTSRLQLTGRAEAEIFLGLLGRLVCRVMGFPRHGADQPVSVTFTPTGDGGEEWQRDFAGRQYRSVFSRGEGSDAEYLIEQMGAITAVFALAVAGDRLRFEIIRCRCLGIPMPWILSPRCVAYESEQDGDFRFDIALELPVFGRLIAYRGVLGQGASND